MVGKVSPLLMLVNSYLQLNVYQKITPHIPTKLTMIIASEEGKLRLWARIPSRCLISFYHLCLPSIQ